jgi:predicted nucleic acid-binding protein
VIVLDASVWTSSFLADDVHHVVSRTWIDAWLVTNRSIMAPTLLLAEVGGAVARRTRDEAIGQAAVDTILLTPNLSLVALDNELGQTTARYAATLGPRGADATYVAVAQRYAVSLLTWDREQATRAADVVTAATPRAFDDAPEGDRDE